MTTRGCPFRRELAMFSASGPHARMVCHLGSPSSHLPLSFRLARGMTIRKRTKLRPPPSSGRCSVRLVPTRPRNTIRSLILIAAPFRPGFPVFAGACPSRLQFGDRGGGLPARRERSGENAASAELWKTYSSSPANVASAALRTSSAMRRYTPFSSMRSSGNNARR